MVGKDLNPLLLLQAEDPHPLPAELKTCPTPALTAALHGRYVMLCPLGYSDFHNLTGFTSKKMPNNIL
jgi:hypothetical protein